jgi:hypothetical protein
MVSFWTFSIYELKEPRSLTKTFWALSADAEASEAACRNPTLAKCGGEAQHLEKLEV